MIRQIYTINNETYTIEIESNEIFYKDRKMGVRTRVIPVDNRLRMKIIMSRNKMNPEILKQFELTPEEEKEYLNCKNETELAEVCKRDCLKNGSILQKEENYDNY